MGQDRRAIKGGAGQPLPRPVTLQTIAHLAGTSRMTVSRALRGHPKVGAALRERIRKLAEESGYRPNPLVSAHMAYLRTLAPRPTGQVIALLCNRPRSEFRKDDRFPLERCYQGAAKRAEELGYRLELFNLRTPNLRPQRLTEILRARGIHGVIVAPLGEGRSETDIGIRWECFAAAMIEHTFVEPRLHKACHDEYSTIGRLVQRLLDYGHTRLGLAMPAHMDAHANHLWRAGYLAYRSLVEPDDDIPLFITPEWTKPGFLDWYRTGKPDAIITINDDVVHWLRQERIRVPEEVSCVTPYWKSNNPEFSGYDQNHEQIAAAAVDLVVGQLHRNERGVPASCKTTSIQATWHEGSTVRRRRAAGFRSPVEVWTR